MKTMTSALLLGASLLTLTGLASAQVINLQADGDFASDQVELNGLGFAEAFPDSQTANAQLYSGHYGAITTGNTLGRDNFTATMEAAFSGGFGGVFGFESIASGTSGNELNFTLGSGVVTALAGANNYQEGGPGDTPQFRGKENPTFDGTGPSSPSPSQTVFPTLFSVGTSGSRFEIGLLSLGGPTSFDLDFNPAEQVSVIGFAMLNYHNFQSYQRGNSDYPNIHARVTWNNGSQTLQQMAVQFSNQDNPNDVYFGFQQPALGYFLDRVELYQIGNSARSFIGADEFGLAVGDGVVVPEPNQVALGLSLLILLAAHLRRRRA